MDAPHDPTDRPTGGLPWSETLPLTTVETFVAAMIEAGPEVAEHMVRAANELLLAAQALMGAAERRLTEQRRLRDAEEAAAEASDPAPTADPPAPDASHLRSVDEVA